MESDLPQDIASGRHLIGGWGIPIDGGVFRREGYEGIVVDTQKFGDQEWYKESLDFVLKARQEVLAAVIACVRKYMPVSRDNYQSREKGKFNRVSLAVFASWKGEGGRELGGDRPDAQALFAALLIEKKLESLSPEERGERAVAVLKGRDGQAVVNYRSKSGDIYRFDPTNGDTGFKKVQNE